jgi:hypothetical protein
LQDVIKNMDLNQFLEILSVADQTVHRPKIEPGDMDHPRFYWAFKNMDYIQWFAQDSGVLLLSGPTKCTLDHISAYILMLMEGHFGKDRIVLNFFSPDKATRGIMPIRRDSKATVTIFVHTLLHQLISSTNMARMSAAYDFLCNLLDSIDDLGLLARFGGIDVGDSLAVITGVLGLDTPDTTLCEALGKALKGEKNLGMVVNVLDNMRGEENCFVTAVSTLVGRLSKKTSGFKALITSGPDEDSNMAFRKLPRIHVQYDKERKCLIALFPNVKAGNLANKLECSVP